MVFSDPIFVFAFFPFLLASYFLTPARFRNYVLLGFSLYFYFYGEAAYTTVLLVSILVNFLVLRGMNRWGSRSRSILIAGISINLGLLIFFKYAGFISENLQAVSGYFPLPELMTRDLTWVHLPIGISFFTFQAISMLVDVHRKEASFNGKGSQMALFITLFPQLIAGPIVRYADIARQIQQRKHRLSGFSAGLQRFIIGLGKKVILANTFGQVCDEIFSLDPASISTPVAWIGIIAYTLQIYFDFSGYSDMAIGLCRTLGFSIKENFLYPYASRSITEFWRRWHISLSTWFRDYLYIPLGGNRKGAFRTYRNLLLVFVLCGLWHGASWNFLIWGLMHGTFLVLERIGKRYFSMTVPGPVRHAYTLLVVILAWVVFRAETMQFASSFYERLFVPLSGTEASVRVHEFLGIDMLVMILVGFIGAIGFVPWLRGLTGGLVKKRSARVRKNALLTYHLVKNFAIVVVLLISLTKIYAGYYDPFIYFRF